MNDKRSIDIYIYLKFYDVLSEKFLIRYWTGDKIAPDKASRRLWDISNPKTQKPISIDEFKIKGKEYFYRKLLEAKQYGIVKVYRSSLYRALAFIGVRPSADINNYANLHTYDKEDILYNQFILDYGIRIEPNNHFVLERKNFVNDLEKVSVLVNKFYNNLLGKDSLKIAWGLLSKKMKGSKDRWNNDFKKFTIGYQNFRGVQNLMVFNINQETPSVIKCLVFFEDKFDAYFLTILSDLNKLKIADIDNAVSIMSEIRQRFKQLGIESFDNIPIKKLFDPVASEFINFTCGLSEPEHFDIYDNKQSIMVRRLYQCTCISENGDWKIDKIEMMPFFSAR
ncbi:hypothetical protein Dfri01_58600 [Dyadobacter frigoris]|uniref:hypothetical protein n=1 Tax=Dyadobacter frigoris TaxID=2576211 RepID=UPI0024A36C35|nr:hypothetical protein [Dyadobacter frigoris]GLU56399.1 hypothetical protein Dfri01_58600 [Dyadobacter frigoris]